MSDKLASLVTQTVSRGGRQDSADRYVTFAMNRDERLLVQCIAVHIALLLHIYTECWKCSPSARVRVSLLTNALFSAYLSCVS